MKLDPDEIAAWRRHPVTQEMIKALKKEDPLHRYRGANDLLSLGRAQGYDMALMTLGRVIHDPNLLV